MRIKLQIVIDNEDAGTTIEDIIVLEKTASTDQPIGLSLAESKRVLKELQKQIISHQALQYFQSHRFCPHCQRKRRIKGTHYVQYRTLFGIVTLPSKRLYHCRCRPQTASTFSPLKYWLDDHNSPELLYIEAKWASMMSYGITADLLREVLPVSEMTNATTVRNHLHQIARQQEQTLRDTPVSVADVPLDTERPAKPGKPMTLGIDGGYVRDCRKKKSNFEVIVAKSYSETQDPKRLGFVLREEDDPQHRLMSMLKRQGMEPHQQITFLSDGADNLRDLQYCMYPESEFVLDYFHLTARITVLNQYGKGLIKSDPQIGYTLVEDLESTKHYLWHGNTEKAIGLLEDCYLNCADEDIQYKRRAKLLKHLKELAVYIQKNTHLIPNYGEKYRYGEVISTAFVESTVNEVVAKRMVKKQQMRWSPQGAHYLLQTRTAVLNGELRDQFKQWYPSMTVEDGASDPEEELSLAA